MSLLFNKLFRFVKVFFPRSKCLLFHGCSHHPKRFGSPREYLSLLPCFHLLFAMKWWNQMPWSWFFLMLSFKPAFPLSFTFIKRLFTSSLLLAIRVASSVYLKLLIFLPAILITGCTSSSPAFHMMYSAKKLNKQGDNIQPCRTPFPILNQSVVPYKVLMVASWLAYRSLRMQVRQSGVPVSLRIFHSLLQSTQSKAFA